VDNQINPKDISVRVIDQRIGIGIGGMDTVVRVLHIPSGIIIEVPRITSGQYYDRAIALEMLETALTHPKYRGEEV
jgi:protein subunit release factor A